MAQTFFAICILAGVVALVSTQTVDFQGCSSKLGAEVDRFRQSVLQAGQKFTNNLQDTAGQATDISAVQQSVDKLIQAISSLTNVSNGQLNITDATSVYLEVLKITGDIGIQFIRPSLLSGGLNSYFDFINSILRANTAFIQAATTACLPSRRST